VQGTTPIRGTQSFVGVMTEIWKRPSLIATELLWRAVAFVPILAPITICLTTLGIAPHWTTGPAASTPPPSPEQALAILESTIAAFAALMHPRFLLIVTAAMFVWIAIATIGRAIILRRLDPALTTKPLTLFALGLLRTLFATLALIAWVAISTWSVSHFVWTPVTTGGDPNVVLAFALIVISALVLFVLWSTIGWTLQAAPIYAMQRNFSTLQSLRAALRSGPLRDKLIEINLVMGIVRVCLIVLAMVFSACPLPFSNVETQGFLNIWWLGVAIFYLIASGYFHVVRAAAYLRLYQTYERPH
jgi:hypothetical protein